MFKGNIDSKTLDDKKEMGYTMTYHCDNCHKDFIQEFEYGERVSQGKCPHCGCFPKREYRWEHELNKII